MAPELPELVKGYLVTDHAAFEMKRRGLSDQVIRRVFVTPEQRVELRPGRVVLQSRVGLGAPEKTVLVRVVVDVDRHPAEVVTAYQASKIAKYWRQP
jgi:hypothetical protein